MAVSLISAVFRQDLPPTQKLVLLALADSANDDDGGCWFLLKTLCAKTGCSERSLRYQFDALEAAGYLRRERRFGRSSLFWLSLDKLGMGGVADAATVAGWSKNDPARVAGHAATVAGHAATVAGHPAMVAPISVSYPGSDPLLKPLKPEAQKVLVGTRRPSAGGFSEGAAKAAPPGTRSPERGRGAGGSTVKPSVLHVSSEPEPELSVDERRANIARLRASLIGIG